jgi:hypothetical protein
LNSLAFTMTLCHKLLPLLLVEMVLSEEIFQEEDLMTLLLHSASLL